MGLEGRTALVTGASGGIGSAICRALAGAGAGIAVHYNTGEEPARQLAGDLNAAGSEARLFQADLVDPDACARLVQEAAAAMGGVQILVNNAGSRSAARKRSTSRLSNGIRLSTPTSTAPSTCAARESWRCGPGAGAASSTSPPTS